MTSSVLTPSVCAVFGLTRTGFAHVILVIGRGSSCSQPLLAKRPSPMVGSGRKTISSPPPCGFGLGDPGALGVAFTAGRAVFGTRPLCRQTCHQTSKFCVPLLACQ